ncbi:LOW QUALITY PROTEIN: hypothetical protein Cgig2_005985 [Carnegiea gigantea]|uniref:Uncharacterized protein n=1 Tax=Carnegiea gigantea TaxID=171969 RepID=A0A9Q1KYD6_9CARY|nr:LOW QUALITY PROTEIN: hypothetical protein Cgig2_005985 [Carnegiea gigantea]
MSTAKKKRAQVSSDREKWEVIFNALKLMLCKQQSQLDSLLQQRNLLEQRIKILYDFSDFRLSEDQVSLMRRQLALAELAKLVEVTKADLVNGSKHRESLAYKLKLDALIKRTYSRNKPYEVLKSWVAALRKEHPPTIIRKWRATILINFERRVIKLTKSDEVDKANEKIMKVIESLEQLHSSNKDKDVKIQTLRADITKLRKELESLRSANTAGESVLKHCEPQSSNLKSRRANRNDRGLQLLDLRITKLGAEASKKNEEISVLSKEIKNDAATPVLGCCTGEPSFSRSRVTRNGGSRGVVTSSAELIHERVSYSP